MKDEKGGLLSKITQFFKSEKDPTSGNFRKKPPIMLLIAAFALIILLIINSITPDSNRSSETVFKSTDDETTPVSLGKKSNASVTEQYEEQYEQQLKDALEHIVGVSDVLVVVNVEGSETQIIEKNRVSAHSSTDETDKEGGKRTIEDQSVDEKVVIIRDGDGEKALVVSVEKPKIRGVLVVAKGAERIATKKELIEAVTRVLDVPSHKVSVQARKK